MALYILFGVAALLIVIFIIAFGEESDAVLCIIIGTIAVLFFTGLLWFFMAFAGRHFSEPDDVKPIEINKYEEQIVSMKSGSEVGGSFFLGCGTIDSTGYYVYYEKTAGGGLQQKKVRVGHAIIFEEENCKPRISWEGRKYTCSNYWLPEWSAPSRIFLTKKHIYVPKGTVIQEFKLD